MKNYRNKTIFDWNTYKENDISSKESLLIMNYMKSKSYDINIKNVIIRNFTNSVGMIIQQDDKIDIHIYTELKQFLDKNDIRLLFFAFQKPINKIFEKGKNMYSIENNFLKINIDNIIISMLPDSFFQPNIDKLNQYYENFIKWVIQSNSDNMINLGDDGGNVCTILNKMFKNMITLFHCNQSLICAEEMIKDNHIKNLELTTDISYCKDFDNINDNIILFINPGRKGLRDYEIDFINTSKNIHYIIYMACNINAFNKDLIKIKSFNIKDSIEINVMPLTKNKQTLIFLGKN